MKNPLFCAFSLFSHKRSPHTYMLFGHILYNTFIKICEILSCTSHTYILLHYIIYYIILQYITLYTHIYEISQVQFVFFITTIRQNRSLLEFHFFGFFSKNTSLLKYPRTNGNQEKIPKSDSTRSMILRIPRLIQLEQHNNLGCRLYIAELFIQR